MRITTTNNTLYASAFTRKILLDQKAVVPIFTGDDEADLGSQPSFIVLVK